VKLRLCYNKKITTTIVNMCKGNITTTKRRKQIYIIPNNKNQPSGDKNSPCILLCVSE
jgi:hypothetical protein